MKKVLMVAVMCCILSVSKNHNNIVDVFKEVTTKFDTKDASIWWRMLDSILPASFIIRMRGNVGNCSELSRYIVEQSGSGRVIYLDKEYKPTYDYRYAVHCAVETDSGHILDASWGICNDVYEGIFDNSKEWSDTIRRYFE